MAKSKARFLSELLGSTGLVKKSKSALAGADEVIDLDTLPTIPNSKLANATISIAGHSTALGGSVSLNTGNIGEHTDYRYFTDARARTSVSVSGDLVYNSSTGVFSFTERTDAEVRGLVSATGSLSYNSTTGVMSFTMPAQNTSNVTEGTNLYFTNARADARIAAASTSDLSEGTNLYYTDARADARVALIVDSAPGTLNTLNELAAALGDDANFSTTVTNSIATKLPLAGGALTGAVTTNSTFDGRNVSVDGAKLDGIETGATADQTAAEILTAVKTVDGSGSGLDADLLDGMNATDSRAGNTIVMRQANGYMQALYVNTTDDAASTSLGWLYGQRSNSDGYHRRFTAASIKTWGGFWASDNDGAGSGLDADLLDGQQGSYYYAASNPSGYTTNTGTLTAETVSSTNAVTITGTKYFAPAGTVTSPLGGGGNASLQAYSVGGNYAAFMAFHRSGYYAINWGLDTSNTMVLGGWSSSTTAARMSIGTNGLMVTAGQGNLWGASNDGSGSGLDADLLDGQQGSYYLTASNFTGTLHTDRLPNFVHLGTSTTTGYATDDGSWGSRLNVSSTVHAKIEVSQEANSMRSAWYAHTGQTGIKFGTLTSHVVDFITAGTVRMSIPNNSGLVTTTGQGTLWGSSNDGAGSGLDADLLDGLQLHTARNNEANKVVRTDANGYIQSYYINTNIGVSEGLTHDLTKIYVSNDDYIRTMSKSNFKVRMNLTKNEYDRMDYTTNTHYHTGANSHNEVTINGLWERGSGFIDNWNSGAGKPPSGSHWNGFQALHYSSSSVYHHGMQMLMSAGNPALTFLRGHWANGGTGNAWQKIWTDGNDGSGSGLDADLLDGQQGSYYLPTVGGNGNLELASASGTTTGYGDAGLEIREGAKGGSASYSAPRIGFHWGGVVASNISIDTAGAILIRNNPGTGYENFRANNIYANGTNTVWHVGNDGSGSGLDADLLDGANAAETGASTIHKIASNGYSQLQNWTNVAGSGLYSSTTNSAHWYPNVATSYGAWRIDGARSGYTGIYLTNGGAVVLGMYDSGGNGGDYHEASGKWSHYWHRGNTCLGINASTTSSSYALYSSGAIYSTNNIVAYSDRRVKENIVQIDGALEKVNKLTGVYYNRIDDKKKNKEIGFIAQDVNEVVPELVSYAEDVDQYGVKYGNTTALLVEAVKELTQQVKDLKQEIDKMKEKQ